MEQKPLIERLRVMSSITTHVSEVNGAATTIARAFTYNESLAAMKLCREAADTLEFIKEMSSRR